MDVQTQAKPVDLWRVWMAALCVVLVGAVVLLVVVLTHHSSAAATPYDAQTMTTARDKCQRQVNIDSLASAMETGRVTSTASDDAATLKCLRNKLPLMSDQQLERIDYWIAQAR